jgi:hypothetical protein
VDAVTPGQSPAGITALVCPMLEGICALPHARKQESPQRHRGTVE